jgi:putative addiction module component (TIGR02574 family)
VNIAATIDEIKSLSVDERLDIVEAIWDSIVADADDLEVSSAERELIEGRLAAYLARPDEAVPWEQVKAEALERIRR